MLPSRIINVLFALILVRRFCPFETGHPSRLIPFKRSSLQSDICEVVDLSIGSLPPYAVPLKVAYDSSIDGDLPSFEVFRGV